MVKAGRAGRAGAGRRGGPGAERQDGPPREREDSECPEQVAVSIGAGSYSLARPSEGVCVNSRVFKEAPQKGLKLRGLGQRV